jgi:hypothetical protein
VAQQVELLASRLREGPEHVTQSRAAQPRVEDERGHDQVGRRVVEVVGELQQCAGQRLAYAQPIDE